MSATVMRWIAVAALPDESVAVYNTAVDPIGYAPSEDLLCASAGDGSWLSVALTAPSGTGVAAALEASTALSPVSPDMVGAMTSPTRMESRSEPDRPCADAVTAAVRLPASAGPALTASVAVPLPWSERAADAFPALPFSERDSETGSALGSAADRATSRLRLWRPT